MNNQNIILFEKYLLENEKAKNTIEKYVRDVKELYSFVLIKSMKNNNDKKSVTNKNDYVNISDENKIENSSFIKYNDSNLSKEILLEYKNYLIKKHKDKILSINSKISSINAYLKFIGRNDLFLKILKYQKNIFGNKEKEFTKCDMEKLLEAAKYKNERLFYLMQTLASTGIRISELEYITVESLSKGKTIVNNKGKIRPIFLPKALCQNLMIYCRNKKITSGTIFITRNGKPINRSSVWAELKKLCKKANVNEKKVFPHNFRHLFAKEFYTKTKDIVKLSSILGHSSIETTRIYILVSEDEVMENIENLGLVRGEKIKEENKLLENVV